MTAASTPSLGPRPPAQEFDALRGVLDVVGEVLAAGPLEALADLLRRVAAEDADALQRGQRRERQPDHQPDPGDEDELGAEP
ncbi:hypothetical protein [Nannocystis pusilla]|uniref:hypothetical protein n=1 Tax=Nannocystis pusilla TaxID=889268 RepID=UPI003DA68508